MLAAQDVGGQHRTRLVAFVVAFDGGASLRTAIGEPSRLRGVLLPEQSTDLGGYVLADAAGDVLVASCHPGVGPPHDAHDGAFWDAEEQEDRGGRMARVAQPALVHARLFQEALPLRLPSLTINLPSVRFLGRFLSGAA